VTDRDVVLTGAEFAGHSYCATPTFLVIQTNRGLKESIYALPDQFSYRHPVSGG